MVSSFDKLRTEPYSEKSMNKSQKNLRNLRDQREMIWRRRRHDYWNIFVVDIAVN